MPTANLLTDAQAAKLTGYILDLCPIDEVDQAALALLAIIRHFAYQDSAVHRDADAGAFERVIYPYTAHADSATAKFVKKAVRLLAHTTAQ